MMTATTRFPARLRSRRRVLALVAGSVLPLLMVGSLSVTAGGVSTPLRPSKLWTCTSTTVVKPVTFVVTCADAYTQLTKTHWTTWTPTSATGVTTFAMNLCTPNCASSKMTNFPNSSVELSRPVSTPHGRLFSLLTVRYRFHGATKTFHFSWKGDPSF